jgi:hypothetical protein
MLAEEFAKICKNLQKFADICESLPKKLKDANIYESGQKLAEVLVEVSGI